jgi:hypothetical protein
MIVAVVRDETARWKEDRALRQRLTELEAAIQAKTSAVDIGGAKLTFGALRPFQLSSSVLSGRHSTWPPRDATDRTRYLAATRSWWKRRMFLAM